ncbi:HAP1 N-terminal domain-containing protein [Caenorhabditis elegans]|uniref:HAP1 N-terminal domain-containing protein n=1 Tax=Caenorhabditis elegans TaxID=6239 RepID=P91503_CAEEL|nr:HAP1 N-terminal domain-containing protein [Caenorhabditis elegans]CCD71997.2 HAP1 N-terminal domain-containing protein [Caenorhabditis elegans]
MSPTPTRNSSPLDPSCALNELDCNGLMVILEKKNHDLELAAKIGQSLLEQNKDLQTKNEFLEESVNKNLDTIVQLKHELNQRIELLRVYSHLDDDGLPRSNSDEALRERLKSTKSENERLRQECDLLRQESAIVTAQKNSSYLLEKQLDYTNDKVISLQKLIEQKTTELNQQYENTGKLMNELADKDKKERMISMEKEEMGAILIEMIQRHDTMQAEHKEMQDQYAELMANFAETESELNKLRSTGNLRMSYDSLYDSLASEMENSEFSPAGRTTQLTVLTGRDSYANDSGIDAGGPMSLAAEIEHSEKYQIPSIAEPIFATSSKLAALCDASTSCTDIYRDSTPTIQDDDVTTPSVSGINAHYAETNQLSFPSEEAVSTPIVARKYIPCSSPSKSNLSKLQRLHIGNRPHAQSFDVPSTTIYDASSYAESKLGQPGMPGTRDLDISLKVIKAREEFQVQKEFAAFCQRKGIDQQQFFGSQDRRQSNETSWMDFSAAYGVRMIQSLKPRHAEQSLALGLRQGVLTRAELLTSPSTSPQHRSLSLSLSPGTSDGGLTKIGAIHGVLSRR